MQYERMQRTGADEYREYEHEPSKPRPSGCGGWLRVSGYVHELENPAGQFVMRNDITAMIAKGCPAR